VEQYGLDELAASAEAVLAGLGPLAAGLARLAVEAGGAVTLEAMEVLVAGRGRELLRGVVQLGLDGQAAAEVRLAAVTGADGVRRTRAERGHARTVVTGLGAVVVRRIAYRAGRKGVPSLFPRDAVLNLPPCGYSWPLQRLAEMFSRSGSYEQAREFVLAVTGAGIGKRQLEQITGAAAAGAERFCQERVPGPGPLAGAGQQRGDLPPLAISADGKGVAMRPEARRRRGPTPVARVRTFARRTGTGEKKGHKRMAETGCVFDVKVPREQRTPEQVMHPDPSRARTSPEAVNRWYACDITARRDVTIGKIFDEADRRDPGHCRTWIALADGDIYQLGLIQAQAAARGVTVTIVIDFIHVLEYLWKAAWCFHAPRDPAVEDWVTAQALDILHGRTTEVIARISQLTHDHPPQGSEHTKIIRKTLHYLTAKQPWMDYPAALAAGWPIATGVIEGACRHLVQDRMGITGARWGLPGAQAILWLRAIHASGDHDAYWTWHIAREHHRNHLSRFSTDAELAA
jgi:hypothetical protein